MVAMVIPLLLATLFHLSRAQDFERPEEISNSTLFLTDAHPLATAFSPRAELLTPLLTHIRFVSRAVQASARAAREDTAEPRTTTCNYRSNVDDWNVDIAQYFATRSWGVVDDDCITDVFGAGVGDGVEIVGEDDPGSDSATIFRAVVDHANGVNEVASQVAKNANKDWPQATRATDFRYSVRTQTCLYEYAGFVRRGGEWYVAERITNTEKDLTLGENQRMFIQEYIRIADGRLINADVELLVNGTEADIERGSTAITQTDGPVTGSAFGEVFAPDNPAVREALRSGEHSIQQASDATTTSNIAILALPLAMNVVPVALIADVNTVGMLVYTLLTDILTTIPLLIKGVEVLSIGVSTNVAVITRVTGANVLDGANKAAEVWVAECRADGDLTATGVVLIIVALGFMVGGVVAEIVAKRWIKSHGGWGKSSAGLVMAGVVGRNREMGAKQV